MDVEKVEVLWSGFSPDTGLRAHCVHAMLAGTGLHTYWQLAIVDSR